MDQKIVHTLGTLFVLVFSVLWVRGAHREAIRHRLLGDAEKAEFYEQMRAAGIIMGTVGMVGIILVWIFT